MSNVLEMISLINKIKVDFSKFIVKTLQSDGIWDLDSQDFMIIFNIKGISDHKITVNDLTSKELYLGANVSYRLKKLKKNQYLDVIIAPEDGRSRLVELTQKSIDLLTKIFESLPTLIGEEKNKEFNQLFESFKKFDRNLIRN